MGSNTLTATTPLWTQRRFKVALAISFAYFVAYFDRTNVAVLIANPQFNDAFGIAGNKVAQGLLLTAFLFPYGLANLVTGPLGDKLGGRKGVSISIISWTIAMFIMGCISNYTALIALRVILGIGESIMTPACNMIVAKWFPDNERARASSAWLAGLFLAPAFSYPVIAWVVSAFGWRMSFFLLGAIGLFIALPLMWFWTKDAPEKDTKISSAEIEYIRSGQLVAKQFTDTDGFWIQARKVFANYKYWLGVIAYCGYTVGFWGVGTFMPSYLKEQRHLDFGTASLIAVLPWVAATILTIVGGLVGDKRHRSRAFLWSIGYVLAAILSYFGIITGSVGMAVLLISLAVGFLAFTLAPMYAVLQDLTPPTVTGLSFGVFNGITYMVGSFSPAIVGRIADATHSFNIGFYVLDVWLIVTAICVVPLWKSRATNKLASDSPLYDSRAN
ncbi:MFS transporter [Aneurinibacillus sp. Ricciae_BoGa-3]|uniref:MFS transporter n=1 Tax=Aneurinibacillus sp. Ricciae_BoGa-3 TaxID=3022697 RepID=UPI00233FC7A8|nr:MFS transporter [Aneurinibacillus sp. Ricciae_BoGa-3]WCK55985.1 MFS transporter [Aneurinibacillus sp. Ricciae_BoGa-3]